MCDIVLDSAYVWAFVTFLLHIALVFNFFLGVEVELRTYLYVALTLVAVSVMWAGARLDLFCSGMYMYRTCTIVVVLMVTVL